MAQKHWFRLDSNDRGSTTILPVGGGPYIVNEMEGDYPTGNVVVQFTDSDGTPVTPTAGTVVFEGSPIAGQWHSAPVVMTIDATTVIAGVATYTLPTFDGPLIASRMTLAGIVGATHVRAYHWRSND